MRLIRAFGLLIATTVLSSAPLYSSLHPIPLKADADCATCHAEKAQGRTIHPALQMGCSLCHKVVNEQDSSYVELKNGGVPTLCFQCHANKKPDPKQAAHPLKFKPSQAGSEQPVAECTTCHTPHASRFPHLLIKGEYGGKGENLCLDCHDTGENVPKGGSRHMALETGCDTCHVLHKQGNPATQDGRFQLKSNPPHLCAQCHATSSSELIKAHDGPTFAEAVCTNCHDPHASSAPFLQKKK